MDRIEQIREIVKIIEKMKFTTLVKILFFLAILALIGKLGICVGICPGK